MIHADLKAYGNCESCSVLYWIQNSMIIQTMTILLRNELSTSRQEYDYTVNIIKELQKQNHQLRELASQIRYISYLYFVKRTFFYIKAI